MLRPAPQKIRRAGSQLLTIVRQGHFDQVIKRYREMHVTSWPDDMPEVLPLLDRLKKIHPNQDTQTHILHLASDGEILVRVRQRYLRPVNRSMTALLSHMSTMWRRAGASFRLRLLMNEERPIRV